jgi:hypothetical protein
MNRELQDYYENRFAMMSTQGWKDLVEDIQVGRIVHHELDQDFKRV